MSEVSQPTIDEQLDAMKAKLNMAAGPVKSVVFRMDNTDAWNPKAPEFKQHLLSHYEYGAELMQRGVLLLAGPSDEFGLWILKVATLEEAQEIANHEPFCKGNQILYF